MHITWRTTSRKRVCPSPPPYPSLLQTYVSHKNGDRHHQQPITGIQKQDGPWKQKWFPHEIHQNMKGPNYLVITYKSWYLYFIWLQIYIVNLHVYFVIGFVTFLSILPESPCFATRLKCYSLVPFNLCHFIHPTSSCIVSSQYIPSNAMVKYTYLVVELFNKMIVGLTPLSQLVSVVFSVLIVSLFLYWTWRNGYG